jgi:hypothetical protein
MQPAAFKMAAEYAIGNESLEWLILFFMVKFRLACQLPCLNFLEEARQLIITTEFMFDLFMHQTLHFQNIIFTEQKALLNNTLIQKMNGALQAINHWF